MDYDVLPGGPTDLTVIVDEDGAIVAAGFRDAEALARHAGIVEPLHRAELPRIRRIWSDYLAGDVGALNRADVRQSGSTVQREVWAELPHIPPARTLTYSEVAESIGRPRAARAVGSACGANRVAPFVPCHRVVAADGGLGGYGYGLAVKEWLLDHEAGVAPVAAGADAALGG